MTYPWHLPPLSDEQRAKYQARRDNANLRKGELKAALRNTTDPLLRQLIDHHAQDTEFGRSICRGCDQGCSCDSPEWPCSTVLMIAAGLGVDTTDMESYGPVDWRSDT